MKRLGFGAIILIAAATGCVSGNTAGLTESRRAEYFKIVPASAEPGPSVAGQGNPIAESVTLPLKVISISPFDGKGDTLEITEPLTRIVCMSTSYIAYLAEAGAADAVAGVSGSKYVSNPQVIENYRNGKVKDVGYDPAIDYETIVSMKPDLVVAYGIGNAKPQFSVKLESLGVRVMTIYDQFEADPLARAEYIRFFGAMTGKLHEADSIFRNIETSYLATASKASGRKKSKVLMNIPYGSQWYVPGKESYMSRLVSDAGGEILGSEPGAESSSISVEEAYRLSSDADFWLNAGWCRTKEELSSCDPMFKNFDIPLVYNNIARATPGGGNDFWESGAVRPDLILEDLCNIFQGNDASLHYYLEVK